MKRPLAFLGAFYVFGVFVGRYFDLFYLALAASLAAAWALKSKFAPAFILFFVAGYCLSYRSFYIAPPPPNELTGTVLDSSKKRIILKTPSQKVLIYTDESVKSGELISFEGEILETRPARNIGGYDERAYWRGKGIYYKSFAKIAARAEPKKDFFYYLNAYSNALKEKLKSVYDNTFPPREAGVMKALVLGDDEDLESDLKELYAVGGILHILSISGTHLSVLTLFFIAAVGKLLGKKPARIFCLGFLFLYGYMVGFSTSVTRAGIMGSVIIAGDLLRRKSDLLTSLSLAALIILVANPSALWNIGFQYSFGAVFGIAFFRGYIYKLLVGLKNKTLVSALAFCLSAELVAAPVSIYYFYCFHPYSLFANLIVGIVSGFLIVFGFLTGVLGLFFMGGAELLSGTPYAILKFYEALCESISRLPGASILLGRFGVVIFLGTLAAFVSFRYRKYFLALAVAASIFTLFFINNNAASLTALDVGQGDSFVLRNGGDTFVIDSGETGRELINYLNYLGADRIDAVLISHTDSDHAGGIPALINAKSIKNLILPKIDYTDDEIFNEIRRLIDNNRLRFISKGAIIESGKIKLECLSPPESSSYKNIDKNNASLVLKATVNSRTALFTGDIESETEKSLLTFDLKADVLKVAHHGSKTSTAKEFLDAVSPAVAIISVGQNSRYGHPHEETIDKLNESGAKIFRTDRDGDVKFIFGKNIKIERTINEESKIRY